MAQPPAPLFAWVLVVVVGTLSLRGISRLPPYLKVEQRFVPACRVSVSPLLQDPDAVFLIPLLLLLRSLYVMFS